MPATKIKKSKAHIVASIEDASILRQFTILFLLMSIIPTVFLYYFYYQLNYKGGVDISAWDFNTAMIFIVLGVLVGYGSMRSLMMKIIAVTKANQKALEKVLSPEAIKEMSTGDNEIAVLSRSFSVITQRLEENVRSLEMAKRTLQSVMTKVGQGISNMENIDTFLELIVETLTNALGGKKGILLLFNPEKTALNVTTVYGCEYDYNEPLEIKFSESSVFYPLYRDKKPGILSGIFLQSTRNAKHAHLFEGSLITSPLVTRDKVNGFLIVSTGEDIAHSQEELDLLFHLATQTAVAIENSRLNKDIEKTYFETISALALAVDAKDRYSRGHLDRVADYAIFIGNKLGLDDNDIKTLGDAARMHDLGKIGIPDDVLRKEGPLTDQEWVLMRKHPEIGESIIKPVHSLQHLCDLIRHHHEKLDGSGYPDGLSGDEISPLVRILVIADIYDALTTDRSYRAKMSPKEAGEILRKMQNQLDQEIVELFIEALEEQQFQTKA
jgi:HD-GYP domain-containing protein (c-di-GMP phosphodiesterase class II)